MRDEPTIEGILERRLPFALQSLAFTIGLLISVTIAVICVVEVEEIVVVPGVVTWSSPKIVISSPDLAVVTATQANVAQTVRKGQALANIRSLEAEVQHKSLQVEVVQALARIARLSLEQQGWEAEKEPPEPFLAAVTSMGVTDMNLTELWRQQRDLYAMRLRNHREERRSIEANIVKLQERIQVMGANIEAVKRRLPVLQEIEGLRRKLFEKMSGTRLDYLRAQEDRLSAESVVATIRGDLSEAETEHEREVGRLAVLNAKWNAELADELDEVRRGFAVSFARLQVESKRAELTWVAAPEDAIILNRADRAVGSVVQKGEHLFTMIPTSGNPRIRLAIPPKSIARLKGHEKINIKFDSLPFQRHGYLRGVIESITSDVVPMTDAKDGKEDMDPTYLANAVIDPTSRLQNVPNDFKLLPGMPLTAEVIVGKRRLITYFTYPLMQAGSRALRESELGPT